MKSTYVCPQSHSPLVKTKNEKGDEIYLNEEEVIFNLSGDIADFTFPKQLNHVDKKARSFYDGRAEAYEKNLHLTFKTHGEDEIKVRNRCIDALNIKEGDKVLEIACGTGRDSVLIADRLGDKGEICLVDISRDMLAMCKDKLDKYKLSKQYCIANACYLPFPDNYFDATYSFGGLGEFSDVKKSLAEMVRVTKKGGKVVVGDESIPVWLRDTDFYKILITTNPQFSAELPLKEMPVEARNTRIRWVIGGTFYLIDFEVGEGEPQANFDFLIPGERGGTYRTRYEGQLEGVSKEAKELAYKIIRKKGVSMHQWLTELIMDASKSSK